MCWCMVQAKINNEAILANSGVPSLCSLCQMKRLQEWLKFVTALLAVTSDGYTLPPKGPTPVVKLLRKSKANNGRSSVLSLDAQDDMCNAYLRTHRPRHRVV